MIQGKLLSYYDNLEQVNEIRKKVFVDELNIPENIIFDKNDKNAIFVLVYEEGYKENRNIKNPVATGRICYDGEICIIDNIAVLKDFRRKQYGDFAVRMLVNKAFTAGIYNINVYTVSELIKFYEKIGFTLEKREDKKHFDCKMSLDSNCLKTKCRNIE